MLTLVLFGDDFASTTLDTAGTIFTAFNPYLTLVIGALLAITVIAILIRVLIHR